MGGGNGPRAELRDAAGPLTTWRELLPTVASARERFEPYFAAERTALGDESLERESAILGTLSEYERTVSGTETEGDAERSEPAAD